MISNPASHTALRLSRVQIAVGLCYALVAFAPLALGTVDRWSWLVLLLSSATALAMGQSGRRRLVIGRFGIVFLILAIYSWIQTLPLSPSLLAWLSPRTALATSLEVGGARSAPLALEPWSGREWAAHFFCLWLAYLISVNLFAGTRSRKRHLLIAMVIVGVAVGLLGYTQKLFLANRIFGVWPVDAFFVSTFVNPNHLAGLLGLAGCLALGLAGDRGKLRSLFVVAGVFLLVTMFLCTSRGAAAAAVVAMFFLVFRTALPPQRKALLVVLSIVSLATLEVVADGLLEGRLINKFARITADGHIADSKLLAWRDDLPLLFDYLTTGIGHGALGTASVAYRSVALSERQTHVENEYLEALIDWGVPMAALFFVSLGALFVQSLKRDHRPSSIAIQTALVFVAAHNIFDFNLETGALGFFTALLLGLIAHDGSPTAPPLPWWPRLNPRVEASMVMGFVALVTVLSAAVLALAGQHTALAATQRVSASDPTPEAITGTAERILADHPTDNWLRLSLANRLLQSREQDDETRALALDFAERGLYLAPKSASLHLLVARLLTFRGQTDRALSHFRDAARFGVSQEAFSEAAALYRDPEELRQVAEGDAASQLALVRQLLAVGQREQACDILTLLSIEFPRDLAVSEVAARLAIEEGDREQARSLAMTAMAQDPNLLWPYLTLAPLVEDADAIYQAGLNMRPHDQSLLVPAFYLAIGHARYERAQALLTHFDDSMPAAARLFLSGQLEEGREHFPQALVQYQAAAGLAPNNVDYHLASARMLERIGILSGAALEYNILVDLGYQGKIPELNEHDN